MWIRDVDLPSSLVEAHRSGNLVIFVGAGASRDAPSGLPDFRRLTADIAADVEVAVSDRDLDQPNVLLGRLADQRVDVRRRVASRLGLPSSQPNRLHEAIVGLAAARPPVRIVTTNYDRHLSTLLGERDPDVVEYTGPALPMGDDFAGLVYIHGSLLQEPRHLMVTDADFGRAYLQDASTTHSSPPGGPRTTPWHCCCSTISPNRTRCSSNRSAWAKHPGSISGFVEMRTGCGSPGRPSSSQTLRRPRRRYSPSWIGTYDGRITCCSAPAPPGADGMRSRSVGPRLSRTPKTEPGSRLTCSSTLHRDSLEALLDRSDDHGSAYLNEWAESDVPILRRLAVHGWVHRTDVDATAKIEWLRHRGWLFEHQLHHEVIQLIAAALPAADVHVADALVADVGDGPDTVADDDHRAYQQFNALRVDHPACSRPPECEFSVRAAPSGAPELRGAAVPGTPVVDRNWLRWAEAAHDHC